MRIGKVIGRVTLSRSWDSLAGGRFVLAEIQDRFALLGEKRKSKESVVVYDHLGCRDGDLIAIAESREATMPFYPEKLVPLDAYNAAILDEVKVMRNEESSRKQEAGS